MPGESIHTEQTWDKNRAWFIAKCHHGLHEIPRRISSAEPKESHQPWASLEDQQRLWLPSRLVAGRKDRLAIREPGRGAWGFLETSEPSHFGAIEGDCD